MPTSSTHYGDDDDDDDDDNRHVYVFERGMYGWEQGIVFAKTL